MNTARAQFIKALQNLYSIETEGKAIGEILQQDKMQFVRLNELLADFAHNQRLVDLVLLRMSEGEFKLGDNAEYFFSKCANEIFFENLMSKPDEYRLMDVEKRMKKLHPLWGAYWFSA